MKTARIIRKNIKLLLRSRISTIVLTLGPLLIILLVGMSFSTNSFNLNIGVFSESYSDLSNDFIDKLANESFGITRFEAETGCIASVEEGQTHACIVFPPDMSIENDHTNVILFHVDQSKVNVVYLVMSTLSDSFGEQSSEISRGLTNQIVTSLFDTRRGLKNSESLIEDVISINEQMDTLSGDAVQELDGMDLDVNSPSVDAQKARDELNEMVDGTIELIDDGLDAVDDLEDHVDGNGTSYLNDLEDALLDANSTLGEGQNTTAAEINKLTTTLQDAIAEVTEKLEDAESANTEALTKLNMLQDLTEEMSDASEDLERKISTMSADIDAIQVTNTENIVSPISTQIERVAKSDNNLGFLFPSLVVMLIMFIGLLLPSTLVIMEKNSRAYFRTFTTPTTPWLFVLTTYLTSMALLFVQIAIILLVSQLYFDIALHTNLFMLLLSLAMIMSFFILSGMLIGYIFNSEEMAMLAAVSIGTLFLLTSGIIFPMESMPSHISDTAQYNPVVMGSNMFKRAMLFDNAFSSMTEPLMFMTLFSAILVVVILMIKKAETLNLMLRKPKVRKEEFMQHFDFGNRKAETLPEFIVSLQNLENESFQDLYKQNVIRDWVLHIYNNKSLANKVEKAHEQKQVIALLIDHLKQTKKQ